MSVLKVTLSVFVLAFSISDVYSLTCLCENDVICNGNITVCQVTGDVCYAAVIRTLKDNSEKVVKGCRPKEECDNVDYCPDDGEGTVCAKYGCCVYEKCVVNYTLGKDFETPSPSPSPTIGLSPTSTMKAPMVSSSYRLEATPSVVPMPEKTKASSPAPIATSSFAAKMTSEPAMQASKSTAQPEGVSTIDMEKMATGSPMKPVPSSITAGMFRSEVLDDQSGKGKGKVARPPCDASGRMLSLGTFFLTATGLLCVLL